MAGNAISSRAHSVQRLFAQGSLDWFDRSYAVDWAVVAGIWILSSVLNLTPVYERDFDLDDSLISNSYGHDQVSSTLNFNLALWLPIVITTACFGGTLMEIHHGIIAVCAGRGLARLITVMGKHAVGRLRPDFLARCKWDDVFKACTGKADVILSGRKSFPSGHSSTAFSGMTFLALWIAGQTAAWCFSVPKAPGSLRSSRMGNFLLTLLPLTWASFVAISRLQDHRHHKWDVIVGSLIGILSATICYLIFWPSPFSAKNFTEERFGKARMLYTLATEEGRSDVFHLTRMEEEEIDVV
ncbi:putative lipid phosphate phosphatase 3, chloroplastic [Hypsizygus marmoreus]|uniref:Lipid phosphate phosphatase 3, chloroplastic n=1 Tax=Hypsizygus marmoreus TaxID=39966 RepID=A0A369JXZ7_HYPMA|nr:putative lipid phosphate phosphatase 3, chloroplastic [Hypsizygus marmoreus]